MKDPKVKLNTNGKYEYVSFSPESKIPSRESEQRTFEFLKQMWHDLFVMPSFTGSPKLPSHRTRHVQSFDITVNTVLAALSSFIPITPYIEEAFQPNHRPSVTLHPNITRFTSGFQTSRQRQHTNLKGPPYCKGSISCPFLQEGLLLLSCYSSLVNHLQTDRWTDRVVLTTCFEYTKLIYKSQLQPKTVYHFQKSRFQARRPQQVRL